MNILEDKKKRERKFSFLDLHKEAQDGIISLFIFALLG